MGLYNFQRRFVPKILSGEKTHTIRAIRAHPDKPGNILHLFTGLRQKGARLLMRVPCLKVEEIVITDTPLRRIVLDGRMLDFDEEEALARRDGFDSFADMLKFWAGRLPFRGHIIHWPSPVGTIFKADSHEQARAFGTGPIPSTHSSESERRDPKTLSVSPIPQGNSTEEP